MAVYTEVSAEQAGSLLAQLGLGPLVAMQPIGSGIENTNYFVTTPEGEWVMTLFERLSHDQLPFYLRLMQHLAQRGLPVPEPRADAQGELVQTVAGKPAALVNRLQGEPGRAGPAPLPRTGRRAGPHAPAVADFPLQQPNLRGLPWREATAPVVRPTWPRPMPPCWTRKWPTSASCTPARPTRACPAAPSTPTCSATTRCSPACPAASA
jgi:homoserine kinase type II